MKSFLRKALITLVLLAIAGGIGWLAYTRAHEGAPKGGKMGLNGPMPVATYTAQKGSIDISVNALGTVTPLATVTVRPQISGTLEKLGFTEGQNVKQGDFLAQIDPRPYQLALEQAQGQMTRDQALLQNAQSDLARYQTLASQDSIAQQQVDTQKALVLQDQGIVQTDKAAVDNAKLNLEYCHITAPLTGRTGLHQVDPGNFVQLSDANGIVVITETQPITVIFSLPEDNLPAITKRMADGATLAATALDRSQTTTLATGALTTVDNQIDTTTGTVKMRAQFDNTDGTLFSNQFVNIRLLIDTLPDVIVIPNSAVQRGTPGTYVYLIGADSTVKMTPVTLGPSSGENIAVTKGLNEGDVIVSDGGDKLKDGAKVKLPGAKAPDGAGAPASDGTVAPAPDNAAPDGTAKPADTGKAPDAAPDDSNGNPAGSTGDKPDAAKHHHKKKQD